MFPPSRPPHLDLVHVKPSCQLSTILPSRSKRLAVLAWLVWWRFLSVEPPGLDSRPRPPNAAHDVVSYLRHPLRDVSMLSVGPTDPMLGCFRYPLACIIRRTTRASRSRKVVEYLLSTYFTPNSDWSYTASPSPRDMKCVTSDGRLLDRVNASWPRRAQASLLDILLSSPSVICRTMVKLLLQPEA